MSERWNYQIKIGLFWGLFMSLFNVLFELQEKSLSVQFSTPNFYLKAIVFILVGIFFLGYVNWKAKVKRESI